MKKMKKLLVMYIVLLLAGVANGMYPLDGAGNVDISPPLIIEWEETAGARSYIWYLDESWWSVQWAENTKWEPEYGGFEITETWDRVHGLENNTGYYWRVDMYINDSREIYEKGPVWHFTTETMPKVPEPATVCLLGLGIMMIKIFRSNLL